MRKRRWVLFIFVTISVVALSTLIAHKVFHTNERIKEFVLAKVRPLVGDDLEITNVHLSLGTIHFFDVHIPFQGSKFTLKIKDVRVGYNLFKALSTRFSPQSFSQDLLLVNPKFIISSKDSSITKNDKDVRQGLFDVANTDQLKNLKFINRLSIRDGEIVFNIPDQKQINIGTSLGGWIFTQNSDSLKIRLEGKLFESESNNLFIDGVVDLAQNVFGLVNINFKDYPIDTSLPESIPDFVTVTGGLADGHLLLSSNDTTILGYNLDGDINIHNLNANLWDKKLNISDLKLLCSIKNWNVSIDTCFFNLNDASGISYGSVTNILDPVLDIGYHFTNMRFAQFTKRLVPDNIDLAGTGELKGIYKGPLKEPYLFYKLNSKLINFNKTKIENIRLKSSYYKSKILIEELAGKVFNNNLNFKGEVEKKGPKYNLSGDVHAEGDIRSVVQPFVSVKIDSFATWLNAEVSGVVDNPVLYGSLGADLLVPNQDKVKIRNAFSFFNLKFRTIPTEKNGGPTFATTLDYNEQPMQFTFQAKRSENLVTKLWEFPGKDLITNFTIDVFGNGSREKFSVFNRIGKHNAELGLIEFHCSLYQIPSLGAHSLSDAHFSIRILLIRAAPELSLKPPLFHRLALVGERTSIHKIVPFPLKA